MDTFLASHTLPNAPLLIGFTISKSLSEKCKVRREGGEKRREEKERREREERGERKKIE